ncbi:MAG: hypothetical protein HZB80_10540, partial [Deltaproteobacteria bacterium]|nr:hypothetical protein [Deltaproteobacteria bacterium]
RVELNEDECIDLRLCENYFEILPDHLVVFLNMCQGAYPGPYQAIYKRPDYKHSTIRPILIASIVKISFEDLHDFLKKLIEALKSSSDDEDEILRVINQFNSDIKDHYDFDNAIWWSKRSGEVSVRWGTMPEKES